MPEIQADKIPLETAPKADGRQSNEAPGSPPEERVLNMVRSTLVVNPKVKNRELYKRAMEIAPQAVKDLSLRQFHATYRLPASRERAIRNGTIKPRKRGSAPPQTVRDRTGSARILLEFAEELSKAESRSDLVRVIGGVDKWVAEIVKTTAGDQ